MQSKTFLAVAAAMAAAALLTGDAHATTLPDAYYLGIYSLSTDPNAPSQYFQQLGSTGITCTLGSDQDATCVSVNFFDTPLFGTSITAYGLPYNTTRVQDQSAFYYEIVGPDNATANLEVTPFVSIYHGDMSQASSWGVEADVYVHGPNGTVSAEVTCPFGTSPSCTGLLDTAPLFISVLTNTVYSINTDANGEIVYGAPVGLDPPTPNVAAYSDPAISFAPGFDSTGYSILLSSGVQSTDSSTPEPATWMTAGLAVAGALLRRATRRKIYGAS